MAANKTHLFMALSAALLLIGAPALAQDAPPDTVEDGGVPRDRLVDEYADTLFEGDEIAAGEAVTALRTGGDFTVTTTVTRQVTNPDGTPATNPDGTPVMETVAIESLVPNPNGPMGWGEVDHSLGLAEAMVENGSALSMEEALLGEAVTTTVTNPDGTTTTTTTYGGGLLDMRADGMGWGQIAKELGFKSLGEIKGKGSAGASAQGGTQVATKSGRGGHGVVAKADAKGHKVERPTGKADRASKPDRVAKVDRPQKVERPSRPERPERPAKPERHGRP
ncbi:hypothetical protein [Agrilutibacter solisilvae]|uniref:Uncharacterized protein n=1 Tax=Agrilutibacter solisilvae TaxID=2763317 RepID=A0A974XZW0_9GAMM|nr:hypothetical protein [Lysobacter solisilvae]QSX78836.1 hypothetical protein I8J32_002610 [Lysobacter solisilvae]